MPFLKISSLPSVTVTTPSQPRKSTGRTSEKLFRKQKELLLLPINVSIGAINLPALFLFVLSLIYMFMTFLEFFIDTEEALTPENVNKNIGQVREITASKVSGSLVSAQERFKNMRENINRVSAGEIIGEKAEKAEKVDEEKEEAKYAQISTGEVEED